MDEKQFTTIVNKLDKILRLLAVETVSGMVKEQDKIELLDSLGFKSGEIDRLLGKSQGYTSVVLYQMKKKKQPKAQAAQTTGSGAPLTTPEVTA